MDNESLRFRRDIQGMRAIAVLLVLAYHAGVPAIAGGYIGVDVFFVLSGFLITGLMVREVRDTRYFKLSAFYARRIRRLLPASAVVLVASGIITLLVLPATRWSLIAGDIGASALYVVNWRFAIQSVDYLTSGAAASPVQHYWSLAVEEQFYLVWPVLLLALLPIWRRRKWPLEVTLMAGVALVSIPSFIWSILLTDSSPGPAFFVSTTRVWEFGVGATLALGAAWVGKLPRPVSAVLGWVGVSAVMVAALLFTEQTPFPGVTALLPVLGTAALIAAGISPPGGALQSALSVQPMQWLGKLSYSLYLWHWPLLVAATWIWSTGDGVLPVPIGLLVVGVSFVPAWISFQLVEAPIHYSTVFARIPRHALALGVVCTFAGLGAAVAVGASVPDDDILIVADPAADGASSGAVGESQPDDVSTAATSTLSVIIDSGIGADSGSTGFALGARVLGDDPANDPNMAVVDAVSYIFPSPVAALKDKATLSGEQCIRSTGELPACDYGSRTADTVIAIVGDSKMDQWLPAIQIIADSHDWRVLTYLASGCALVRIRYLEDPDAAEACASYNERRYEALLANSEIDYVITSQRASRAFIPDETNEVRVAAMVEELKATWLELEEAGIDVIVVPDNPDPSTSRPDCVAGNPDKLSECAFPFDHAFAISAAPVQLRALEGLDNVQMASVQDWICSRDLCPVVIGNVLMYRQGSHLTATYVQTLASRLDAALLSAMSEG
jgi:peptidoglycan/LPS O-acetylase OafA/YrhL